MQSRVSKLTPVVNRTVRFTVSLFVTLLGMVLGMQYEVGGPPYGWALPDELNDLSYQSWAESITNFYVGDSLVFIYDNNSHTVAQVSGKDFQTCNVATSTESIHKEGLTIFILEQVGFYYFISTGLDDCTNGMKFALYVKVQPDGKNKSLHMSASVVPVLMAIILGVSTIFM